MPKCFDGHKNASRKGSYKAGVQAFQNEYFEKVASRCGMARTGPSAAASRVPNGTREQKMSMSIAKAESAVLDSAAQREVNAAKQEKANADAAEMLAKRSAKCSTPCRKRSACKPRQIANTSKQSGS